MAWRIGVAYPLINHSFRHPVYRRATLVSNYISGSTITLDASSSAGKWRPGYDLKPYVDYVTLGPSTYSGYAGKTERQLVASGGTIAQTITMAVGGPTYRYMAGDPVAYEGTNFPGGWDIDSFYSYFTALRGAGYDDLSCLVGYMSVSKGSNLSVRMGTYDSTLASILPKPEPDMAYDFGVYYKMPSLAGTSATVRLYCEGMFASGTEYIPLTQQANWTYAHIERTAKPVTTIVSPTVRLEFNNTAIVSSGAWIDCVHLNHSWSTIGTPELGSVQIQTRETPLYSLLANGCQVGQIAGSTDEKYAVSAKFVNLGTTAIGYLSTLFDWQNRGNMLILDTGLDDIPPFLIGRMDYSVDRAWYNLNVGDVQFHFVEG